MLVYGVGGKEEEEEDEEKVEEEDEEKGNLEKAETHLTLVLEKASHDLHEALVSP